MADEENKKISNEIPDIIQIERRFSFIKNDTLRVNISLAFQYIIFLITVLDQEEAEGTTIGSSIQKNLIIYTATIIEGCLHYCLKSYLEKGRVKNEDVMKTEWLTKEHKRIYDISESEYICGAIRYEKTEPYNERLQSQELNRACKRANILTERLFEKAEEIREKRNKIHLAGLGAIDSVYTKKDAQDVFNDARDIIGRVETLLIAL